MTTNLTQPSNCSSFSNSIMEVALPCLFFLMFPLALLLNGVAFWVSLHLRSSSTFIIYLKNLVVSDLVMTVAVPLLAASRLPGATLGLQVLTCRFSNVIFFTCMYISITLLGLISLDRFFKVVRPRGRLLGQNLLFSRLVCGAAWVVLYGATAIPTMILTDREPNNRTEKVCMSLKGPAGLRLHTVVVIFMDVLFWSVSVLVVFCYVCITNKVLQSFRDSGSNNSQGQKKTKLRVFLVLMVFFVCFVPYHMVRIPLALQESYEVTTCSGLWVDVASMVPLWLSTTNVCLDPLLYVFLCKEFREKLMEMVKRRRNCVSRP
ncbi:P2Y purinoceptor 13-like [Hypomesus transpacificus]|uniref:P2Y purinoceptor 13-like n=1 Tax=Hypomesus transpacificus TaxID=137520 RepID=UPI001F07FFC7|nr:P2Y purinoceptor 13-like [Hypomesus transpacificus]